MGPNLCIYFLMGQILSFAFTVNFTDCIYSRATTGVFTQLSVSSPVGKYLHVIN